MKPSVHRPRTAARALVVLAAAAGMTLAAAPAMAAEGDDDVVGVQVLSDDPTEEPTDEPTDEPTVEPTTEPTSEPSEVPSTGPGKQDETVTLMIGPSGVQVQSKAGVQTKPKATLPDTGSSATGPVLGAAALLLAAGTTAVAVRRARQTG